MTFVYRTSDGYKMTIPVTAEAVASGAYPGDLTPEVLRLAKGETWDNGFGVWERIA